jgi:hypothetical protein
MKPRSGLAGPSRLAALGVLRVALVGLLLVLPRDATAEERPPVSPPGATGEERPPVAVPGATTQERPAEASKQNALSYKPLAILSRGMVVQYERSVEPFSIVAGSGLRAAARDDFSSVAWLTHLEGRWWFLGEEPITDLPGMGGLYLGVGLNAARTELHSDSLDRSIGVNWTLEESLRFGYRFVLFGLQEITPSVTAAAVHDFDEEGRLAPTTRPTIGFDLTVGWLF